MAQKVKISGVTIIKNAVKFDYPFIESITSVLPLVDEMIVSVGDGDDTTEEELKKISSEKIKIVHSVWDKTITTGGAILAVETNKVLQHVAIDSDWIFYIQADEVVHEEDYEKIIKTIVTHTNDKRVEGFLFNYKHFYGTFDYVGDTRKWYNHEVRIIRNDKRIYSYRDAQGFQKNKRPLKVKETNACIYHYGWVRTPKAQNAKLNNFYSYWNGGHTNNIPEELFDYMKNVDSVAHYTGTHPTVMQPRIANWKYPINWDVTKKNFNLKHKILYKLEQLTGYRFFDYKNYKLLK